MVSIRELAKLCDVTEGTVSRALSGSPKVSEKTRTRIAAAAKKFNYNPNALVRGIFTGKTKTVGMTIFPVSDEFNIRLINGALKEFCAHDYRMMLMPWPEFFSDASDMIRKFNEYRIDGIILNPIIQRDFNEYKLELEKYYGRIVVVDQRLPSGRFDFVGFDDLPCTKESISHFLKDGRKRIGWVCHGFCESAGRRFNAYLEALAGNRIFRDDSIIVNTPVGTPESVFRNEVGHMLESGKPDAVLAFNDTCAISVLNCAADLGRNVPGDLSVIGYGGLETGKVLRPRLSSIVQDIEKLGRTAASILLRRLTEEDETFVPETILLPDRLEIHGT